MAKKYRLTECYCIKVRISDKTVWYKIGESTSVDQRVKTFTKEWYRAIDIKKIGSEVFPIEDGKRFTDKEVRAYLIKNGFAKPVDSTVVESCLGGIDGATEFLEFSPGISDEYVWYLVSASIEDIGKKYENYFKKIEKSLSAKISKEDKSHWAHCVPIDYVPIFNKMLPPTKTIVGKTILMIGQFANQIIDNFASHNNVVLCVERARCVKYQPVSCNPDNVKTLYYTDSETNNYASTFTWEELINELRNMKMKFDFIIANPPYSIGNAITDKVVHNVEFNQYINLMPRSCYKKNNLFAHLTEAVSAPNYFDDAIVGDVLTIASLKKSEADMFKSYDEFEMTTFESALHKFYFNNNSRKMTFKVSAVSSAPTKDYDELNQDTDFFVYLRTPDHGVDMTGGMYDWNTKTRDKIIDKDYFEPYIVQRYKSSKNPDIKLRWYGSFIFFNTPTEKKNFTDWYYRNGNKGLVDKLIKGIKRGGGTITPAIPRVDWSRPWTDEEILLNYGYTPEEIRKILA